MSRVWADRIVRTLLTLLAASVLWVVVYEIAVGARYRKNDPTEGASRWALIRAQFADQRFLDVWVEDRAARAEPFLGAEFNIRPRKRKP